MRNRPKKERRSQVGDPTAEKVDVNKLTKAERIQQTWMLPELREDLYKLMRTGFPTGSAVYGDERFAEDEDWCIMIPPDVFKGFTIGMTNRGYWEHTGFSALYAHYEGTLLNIICFSDQDLYKAWFQATEYMKLAKDNPIQQDPFSSDMGNPLSDRVEDRKWARVRMFASFVDSLLPVKQLPADRQVDKAEALQYHKCSKCGRKAVNFTCYPELVKYRETGICERCREEAKAHGVSI